MQYFLTPDTPFFKRSNESIHAMTTKPNIEVFKISPKTPTEAANQATENFDI